MAAIQIPVKRTAKQEERQLQAQFVEWFRYQYPQFVRLLVCIPNGVLLPGNSKQRAIMGRRLKEEGLLPGASDLFLFIPSGELHGMAIELKTRTGTQSDEQKAFEAAMLEQGYGYVMPRSLNECIKAVNMYLETGEY